MQSKTETSSFWNNFIKKKNLYTTTWTGNKYFCDVILIEIEIVYSEVGTVI